MAKWADIYTSATEVIEWIRKKLSPLSDDLDANDKKITNVGVGDGSDGSLFIFGRYQVYTTNGTADTEDTIAHGLGRTPVGFIVVNSDKAARLYDSGTSWTSTNIYLKCDVASATVTIIVF